VRRRKRRRRRRTWRLKKTTPLSLYLSLSALCACYIAQPEAGDDSINKQEVEVFL
jgi:hypothetical protein